MPFQNTRAPASGRKRTMRRKRRNFRQARPGAKAALNFKTAQLALSLARTANRNIAKRKWYRRTEFNDLTSGDIPLIDKVNFTDTVAMSAAGWNGAKATYTGGKTGVQFWTVGHMDRSVAQSSPGWREGNTSILNYLKSRIVVLGAEDQNQSFRIMLVKHKTARISPADMPRIFDSTLYPEIESFFNPRESSKITKVLFDKVFTLAPRNLNNANFASKRVFNVNRVLNQKVKYDYPSYGSVQTSGAGGDPSHLHDIADGSYSFTWIFMTNGAPTTGGDIRLYEQLTYVP